MRFRAGVILGGLCTLLIWSLEHTTVAQPNQIVPLNRIGVVSVMRILQNCKRQIDHKAKAQAEYKELERELRKLAQELDVEKAQLATFLPGTDDYLEQKERVGTKQVHLEALQEHYTQQTQEKERAWTEQLYKDILAAAQKIAEAKGLGLVFERSEPVYPIPAENLFATVNTHKLIYCQGCIDITDAVRAEIDK